MADRTITAEALITARDGTGDVFVQIAKKLADIGKSAKASPEVERMAKALHDAQGQLKAIENFRGASKTLDASSLAMAKARQEARLLGVQIAGTAKPTATMLGKMVETEKAVMKATDAFKRQGVVVRDAKAMLDGLGMPLGKIASEQQRLKGVIESTTQAIERQVAADRQAAEMAEQVARANRLREKAERDAAAVMRKREHEIARQGFGHFVLQGAAAAVSAHGVVSGIEKGLEAGAERQHVIVGMRKAGMKPDEIARAATLAGQVAHTAPNLSTTEIMELHKEARSAVQHPDEVFELMPSLAQAASLLKGMGAENANIADMVKAGESLGLMSDQKRFHAFLNGQVKAMQVMGKTITTEQVYEAAKYSKSAGATLSDDFINLTLPSLIQEMHGSSAGDALSALTKRWRGGLAHQHLAVERLNQMGLLEDPKQIKRSKSGEIMGYMGKLKGDDLLGTDPDKFFREIWEPAAEKVGAKTLGDKIKLLNETLPGTAANLGRIFLQQEETLKQHRENYKNAPDLDASMKLQEADPKAAVVAFQKALEDLEAAVTGPMMPTITSGLDTVSGWIRDLADVAKDHPIAAMTAGGVGAAAALAAAGKLAYNFANGFGMGPAAVEMTSAAGTQMTAADIQLQAAKMHAGAAGPGSAATQAAETAGGGGLLAWLRSGLTSGAALEGAAGTAGLGLMAGMTWLVKKAGEAQLPGMGGAWSAPTKETETLDRDRLADMRQELDQVNAEIETTQAKSKLGPGMEAPALLHLKDRASELENQIRTLVESLGVLHGVATPAAPLPLPRPALPEPLSDREAERSRAMMGFGPYLPPPASLFHPDDDRLSRSRTSDADAWFKELQQREEDQVLKFGNLGTSTDAVKAAFDGLRDKLAQIGGNDDHLAGGAGNDDLSGGGSSGGSGGGSSGGSPGGGSPGGGGNSAGRRGSYGGGRGGYRGFGAGGKVPSGPEAEFIKQYAASIGIDPMVALRVAQSEGLGVPWGSGIDHGKSFGAFQLFTGGGLGNIFQRQTGKDPRNPANWKAMDKFALDWARTHGWNDWHGAKRVHIGPMQGIGGRYSYAPPSSLPEGGSDDGGIIGHLQQLRRVSNECVALAKAAVGVAGSVRDWRKGDHADDGTLRPGTPIATFLNRDGSPSDRYAGGGTGTRGAHLDHAGVFLRYIMGPDGKPIGMQVAEQYARSHGQVRSKAYYFGRGWGEGNGSNYWAIKGRGGSYLGGDRNPMGRALPTHDDHRAPLPAASGAAGNAGHAGAGLQKQVQNEAARAVMAQLEGMAHVRVHVKVDGGRVKDSYASSRGHIRASVGPTYA